MQMLSIPPYVSYATQLQYKVLPNLDGETCTYPGLLWRLVSGSLVVKQETANEQWFSDIVLPWKHYVPTDEFLGDIIEQIQWALEHPQEAKQMTHDAFDLVYEHILPMHIDAYIIRALQKYSALLR